MPQAGLSGADLIVEELVEGGVTRLAAFYNSELPTEVGPIRSMRASDIGIVPTDSTIVTSGAAGVTISRMQSAKIPFISEGAKGVYRASGRFAPHNLMANLADISTTTRKPKERPADYLPWGTKADLPKGGKAVSLAASFGSRTTTWAYDKDGYRNTNTYAAADDQFIADSVLVLRVQTGDAGYLDPSGSYVPETKFEGEGAALLFHGGRVIKATWKKDELRSQLTLTAKGKDLVVPAGHTFVELVPISGGGVSYAKK